MGEMVLFGSVGLGFGGRFLERRGGGDVVVPLGMCGYKVLG